MQELSRVLCQMSWTLAEILGGAAGAVALVVIIAIAICCCFLKNRGVSRTSETGSSDPSSLRELRSGGIELSFREAKSFNLEELSLATKNFSSQSLIGAGKFGEVYKGLLNDGILVAIKRRISAPTQDFIEEVRFLSSIRHRNIVTLLGYCQDSNLQVLVYEYVPNGSVSSHLYGTSQVSLERLEFKHRLSIALGAAKGLAHLHSVSPRLLHKNFKTSNVLVDENFIAKVADAGIRSFLGRFDAAGPSSQDADDEIFLAPEVKEFRQFSEKSDVYSFGVFLLELVSAQEASKPYPAESSQNLVEWVQNYPDFSSISKIIDQRLGRFTMEGMEEFARLIIRCIDPSNEGRPMMSYVVMELDRILDKEMHLTTGTGEGTPTVTLGSQLFKAFKDELKEEERTKVEEEGITCGFMEAIEDFVDWFNLSRRRRHWKRDEVKEEERTKVEEEGIACGFREAIEDFVDWFNLSRRRRHRESSNNKLDVFVLQESEVRTAATEQAFNQDQMALVQDNDVQAIIEQAMVEE
ncbi:hypothetical protein V2J09_005967 [Rumex salicifolius]